MDEDTRNECAEPDCADPECADPEHRFNPEWTAYIDAFNEWWDARNPSEREAFRRRSMFAYHVRRYLPWLRKRAEEAAEQLYPHVRVTKQLVIEPGDVHLAEVDRDDARPPPPVVLLADTVARHAPPVRALTPFIREERAA
jgi:flavin-dependent dehydrogenase